MPSTRVKVKRAEVIAVVRKRREQMVQDHVAASEKYPAALAAWKVAAIVALRKAADVAEKTGKLPPTARYDGGLRVEFAPRPERPAPLNLCQVDRMLKTLQMGAEETIALSEEDADRYFGPCPTNGRRRRR